MKQFTKISLVTILSFIGVILTVMFRDVVFQASRLSLGRFFRQRNQFITSRFRKTSYFRLVTYFGIYMR